MSNRPKETVEDKLVDHIKSDTLMRAIADEDTLNELAERAVKEAFFQEEEVKDGYGRTARRVPALPVAAAKAVATGLAHKTVVNLLENDEEMKKIVEKIFYEMLPQILTQVLIAKADNLVYNLTYNVQNELENTLRDRLRDSGLTPNF